MKHSKNKPIITLNNVSVKRGEQIVVKNVNANIHKKDIVAIIGPNGAGKSTLVKAILGLIPYSGTISILNKDAKHSLEKIGYVPQKFSFDKNFPLTVNEFLKLSSKNSNKIDYSLSEVEMRRHENKKLGSLSSGQLQRILIARALMNNPEILFLDEPTAGVDLEGEKDFYDIIQNQNKKYNTTIIMISHELNIVYAYANQVLCLNRDLCCSGKPKDAITKKVLERLYGKDTTIKEHCH